MTKPPHLRTQARALRTEGKTYPEIAALLNISKSTCSLWLRDLPHPQGSLATASRTALTEARRVRHERVSRERAAAKQAAASLVGPLSSRDLLLAGAMLYRCEGAKEKPGGPAPRVDFINSDPAVIAIFLRFLARLGVPRESLRFQLQVHETADEGGARAFWRALVDVEDDQFGTSVIKPARAETNRRNIGPGYRGCLRVRVVRSAALYHRIMGLSQGIVEPGGDPVPCGDRVVDGRRATASPSGRSAAIRRSWRERNAATARAHRSVAAEAAGSVGELTPRELLLLGAVAYWCEGAKDKPYQRREAVTFVNSDPALVVFFLRFLAASGVSKERLRFRVQMHESADIGAAHRFWRDVTGSGDDAFRKPALKRHVPRTTPSQGAAYRGCLRVDVTRGTEMYRRIEGWALAVLLGEAAAVRRWRENG
ncbi:hypothetical protein [Actinomadura flavalba]|uniref:hypothetical protein n=1 Tax=Actinomadura flavalba TaxID=1120938 RepID=UPI00035D2FA6|nr:hypothetical protein [Actinomadura flavalba]